MHCHFIMIIFVLCPLKFHEATDSSPQLKKFFFCVPQSQGAVCNRIKNTLASKNFYKTEASIETVDGIQYNMRIVDCVTVETIYDCLDILEKNEGAIMKANAELMFGISQDPYYSQIIRPIAAPYSESCAASRKQDCKMFVREYSVVYISDKSDIRDTKDILGRKVCFDAPTSTSGWRIPIYRLNHLWKNSVKQTRYGRETIDLDSTTFCPVDFDVAHDLFGASCVTGHWADDKSRFQTKFHDGLRKDCKCPDDVCEQQFKSVDCLIDNLGEVAFSTSSSSASDIQRMVSDKYKLLCDGKSPVSDIKDPDFCNWGVIPGDAFIIATKYKENLYSNDITPLTNATLNTILLQRFLPHVSYFMGEREFDNETDKIDVVKYLGAEHDNIRKLAKITKNKYYDDRLNVSLTEYLEHEGGNEFTLAMENSYPKCDEGSNKPMRLCVLDYIEKEKCRRMQIAWASVGLVDKLVCVIGYSEDNCAKMVIEDKADLAVLFRHRADHYSKTGLLTPILAEHFENNNNFGVAVVQTDRDVINSLEDINTGHVEVCSAGVDSVVGWELPNRVLKKLGIIDDNECRLAEKWSNIFKQGCVPGISNTSVMLGRFEYGLELTNDVSNLCVRCGGGQGNCKTPSQLNPEDDHLSELFYGSLGALRCLMRKKGHVAFVDSHTLEQLKLFADTKDQDFGNINGVRLSLMCSDGKTKVPYSDHSSIENCNLGPVLERLMVTRPPKSSRQSRLDIEQWTDLWILAQERSRTEYNWLKTSLGNERNAVHIPELIFSNQTESLVRMDLYDKLHDEGEHYVSHKVMDAWKDPFECVSNAVPLVPYLTLLICLIVNVYRL